ncbi:MAG: PspA/IM30 family protein [Candidatus Poribacteria bacterium]|nr:PspA/IM30 family protein [Candidatus Poribacteria bacterium]
MPIIKVAGEKFKLASRFKRLCAFLLDIGFLGFCNFVLFLMGILEGLSFSEITIFSILSLLFMDGIRGGFGKSVLSLKVIRLKDGKPATFKDKFIRRFLGIFQPVDGLFAFGEERQRMADKFAKTVVVQLDSPLVEFVSETGNQEKDIEKVLEDVIIEITNRFSEAKQKVDASIGIEKQFQNAHDGAVVQAERCEERAMISLKAGREDLAREDLAQRNEYRQLASQYKAQWEEQKQAVTHLTTLLETLQQKTQETQRERDVVIAQHRNVDAQEHLQQTLSELQDNKAFEVLKKMGQNVTEAASLAKAASEVDIEFKNVELNREFVNYAEDEAIDKELAELKEKLQ